MAKELMKKMDSKLERALKEKYIREFIEDQIRNIKLKAVNDVVSELVKSLKKDISGEKTALTLDDMLRPLIYSIEKALDVEIDVYKEVEKISDTKAIETYEIEALNTKIIRFSTEVIKVEKKKTNLEEELEKETEKLKNKFKKKLKDSNEEVKPLEILLDTILEDLKETILEKDKKEE